MFKKRFCQHSIRKGKAYRFLSSLFYLISSLVIKLFSLYLVAKKHPNLDDIDGKLMTDQDSNNSS